MKADTFQARSGHNALELVIYAPLLQRGPGFIGEYQLVRIVPDRTGPQLHLRLTAALGLESAEHQRGGGDGPAFPALRGDEQARLPVLQPGELLVDGDLSGSEVHHIPGKAQKLALPHTCKQGHPDKVLQRGPFGGLQQGGNLLIVKRMYLFSVLPGQLTAVRGIAGDVVQVHRLLQGPVQHLIDQPCGCRGQLQTVDKALHHVWVEVRQLHSPQGGEYVVPDGHLVCTDGTGLKAAQIVPLPDVQPLSHGEPGGGGVGALVDLHGGGLHLLPDLLLGLAGETALYLLAGAGIAAGGDPGLPVGIRLAVAGDGLLADCARALCIFSRHDEKSPF